jgi:hypothetical protein
MATIHATREETQKRGFPGWLVAVVIAAVLGAAGMWWITESKVSEYDDVVAQLEATEDALAAAKSDKFAAPKDGDAEIAAVARARFEQAEAAAMLLGYFAGANPDLVTPHGWWNNTWSGVVSRDIAVESINDPVLTSLYWQYLEGGGGPFQEVAANEFLVRLVEATIEPIGQGLWKDSTYRPTYVEADEE